MKKVFQLITVLILIFLMCFSTTGCIFTNNGVFYQKSTEQSSTDTGNSQQTAEGSRTPVVYSETVTINKGVETEETYMSMIDAIKKVERTSVALYCESASGSVASGSGVIIDMDNGETNNYIYVITCFHMIETKGKIQINIPDETCNYENKDYIYDGYIGNEIYTDKAITLVGGDKDSDIALVKINLDLPASSGKVLTKDKIVKASIPSDTYKAEKGEKVFAIGNPTGALAGSVCDGIISWLERENQYISGVGNMNLMQISVTTNHGSSGGGLYNLYGELIGITNAGSDAYTAINYAIPCELSNGNGFVNIATQLLASATATNYGRVKDRREKYGFTSQQNIDNEGKYYLTVTEIVSNSQANLNGLLVNDVINFIVMPNEEQKNITTTTELTEALSQVEIGETFVLNVSRRVSTGFGGSTIQAKNISMTAKAYWFCDTGK